MKIKPAFVASRSKINAINSVSGVKEAFPLKAAGSS